MMYAFAELLKNLLAAKENGFMNSGSRRSVLALTLLFSAIMVSAARAGQFEAGLSAANRGDYATALTLWRPLAEAGDAVAQFNIGISYLMAVVFPRMLPKQRNGFARQQRRAMLPRRMR